MADRTGAEGASSDKSIARPRWRRPWILVSLVLLALGVLVLVLAGVAFGWVWLGGAVLGSDVSWAHWLVLLSIPMAGAAACAKSATRFSRGTERHDRWIAAASVLVIFAVATAAWIVIHL